jgi:type III pantothenate kinase
MSALVAVTLGNSTAALAVAVDGRIARVHRVPVARLDDLAEAITVAVAAEGAGPVALASSSVNPMATARLVRLAADRHFAAPELAGRDFPIPIRVEMDEPEGVGTDRLLAAVGAVERAGAPCVVVDCGTAITVNAISAAGAFVGGAIMPGLGLMARVLSSGTAQLPEIVLGHSAPAVGKSTVQAMAGGILHGAGGAVERLVAEARAVVGPAARVLVTGGDAARVAPHLPDDCREIVPTLVLEGLIAAWTRARAT